MFSKTSRQILSGTTLIAGTCIGAGMLGVPLLTGVAGLFPCLLINTICWLYMLITGLLFAEAILWSRSGDNILSISERFLGKGGKWLGGTTFIYLYYCLLVAYFSEGSLLFSTIFNQIPGVFLSSGQGQTLFLFLFGGLVFLGTKFTDRLNTLLFFGLLISFALLLLCGFSDIEIESFLRRKWRGIFLAAPVLFSTYGYHNILPSVATYTERKSSVLRWSIILGTSIPFICYSLWQAMIIGTIPQEALLKVQAQGQSVTQAIIAETKNPSIYWLGLFFSFFAIVTSFLGVSLSMVDFLGDGFKIRKRSGIKRFYLCLLCFLPPFFLSFVAPGIFIEALGVAGGFGEATLNGLFPIFFVWKGKKENKPVSKFLSQNWLLATLLIFTLFIMLTELLHLTG